MTRNVRFVEDRITLKYGTGGAAMRALIEQVFAEGFGEQFHASPKASEEQLAAMMAAG